MRIAKKPLVIAVIVLVLTALGALCWRFVPGIYTWITDPAAVHAFVDEHAVLSRLALFGINVAQVVLAFLPGEPVELASGYAFGFIEGTLVCLAASAFATTVIYLAVRRWGWSVVGIFFKREELERYRWLQDARRLELTMLAVFLIPGTPKDFLTYFAGLTRMRFPAVLAIATFGRIPSIVTSTLAAAAFGEGEYGIMVAAVVVAIALAAAGGAMCRHVESR